MKPTITAIILLWSFSLPNRVLRQDEIIPGNKIRATFKVELMRNDSIINYEYTLFNSIEAKQEIYRILILPGKVAVINCNAPLGWFGGIQKDEFLIVNFVSRNNNIKPGDSLKGFSFKSGALPGIIGTYTEGKHPLPKFQPGEAPDSIPGYDLTPFGSGVLGKSVGPLIEPAGVSFGDLLDTLISYNRQSLELGWTKNRGIANSLAQKLENARKLVLKKDHQAAKNVLEAFLNELEAQKEKNLSSEAYALLKFNAEYLISKL